MLEVPSQPRVSPACPRWCHLSQAVFADLLGFLHLNLKTTLSVPMGPAEGAECIGVALERLKPSKGTNQKLRVGSVKYTLR